MMHRQGEPGRRIAVWLAILAGAAVLSGLWIWERQSAWPVAGILSAAVAVWTIGRARAASRRAPVAEPVHEEAKTSIAHTGGEQPGDGAAERLRCLLDGPSAAEVEREAVVRSLNEELAHSKAELEQFVHVVSHDLQEPIRLIAGFVQLLERRCQGKLDSQGEEYIASATEALGQMQQQIHDLVEYSRVTTRSREFKPTACEKLLEEVVSGLRAILEENAAVVTHDPLPTVAADASQLRQVFHHLISNAIKFRADRPPRVHVRAEQNGNEWLFAVEDNGIGIDPKYAERIFVIFQRLHTRSEYPGTGLGLALSKKIVERHQGRIWVESEPGKGAAFHFTIPRNAEALRPATTRREEPNERALR